jgi:hypothetical protein
MLGRKYTLHQKCYVNGTYALSRVANHHPISLHELKLRNKPLYARLQTEGVI